ncbi:MAG: tetratricopeptide repeat protein, partial [bacterium]
MIKINKLLKKYHNDWNQILKEASLLEDRGAIDDAIAIYTAFLSKTPSHAGVQEALATAFLKGGEFSKSYSAFNKALKWGANRPQTYLHKGIVEARLGLHEEAFESINQALRLKENYSLAHNNLGLFYKDVGRLDEAVDSYRRAIACDPAYTQAHSNLLYLLYFNPDHN